MRGKRFLSLLSLILGLFCTTVTVSAQEPQNQAPAKEEGINITEIVFGHISDSHEWHFFSTKSADGKEIPFAIPLPMIIYSPTNGGLKMFSASHFEEWHKDANGVMISNSHEGVHIEKSMKEKVIADDGSAVYDFSLTKNVISMFISIFILLYVLTKAAKGYKYGPMNAPKGLQNAIEVVVLFIRDEVAIPNLGKKNAPRLMPLLLTVFFFIWVNNLLGLLPGGANFTGNIAVTLFLSIVTFIYMMVNSNAHFWSHLLNPPNVPFGVKILLVLIEIMSLIIKPVALTIRLFANMLAGHIVILSVISMIFIFAVLSKVAGAAFVPVSLAFSIFMFMLELLVAAIQAFIFTNLTSVFLGQSMEEAHHEEHHHDDHHKEVLA